MLGGVARPMTEGFPDVRRDGGAAGGAGAVTLFRDIGDREGPRDGRESGHALGTAPETRGRQRSATRTADMRSVALGASDLLRVSAPDTVLVQVN